MADYAVRPIGHRCGFQQSPLDVDTVAKTITCPTHGPGSPLRIRLRKTRVSYYCRRCDKGKPWRANPEEIAARRRWRQYGLSSAEYEIMVQAQGGRCLICQQTPASLVVDHDHESGAVRGLLCHGCNTAMGFMKDDPKLLTRAAAYLRRKTG